MKNRTDGYAIHDDEFRKVRENYPLDEDVGVSNIVIEMKLEDGKEPFLQDLEKMRGLMFKFTPTPFLKVFI